MAEWYVKDLSKLTGVSVQTLHHYDRIELLRPSVRLANGYRVYSEQDLLHLQQIIALKFFGFELSQIKALLTGDAGAIEHFTAQAQLLEQKANTLLEASKVLKQVTAEAAANQSIPWESIIKLIEVYRMTQKIEEKWVKEIFTPEEMQQYIDFETQLKANSTPEQKAAFEKSWADLMTEIKDNLDNDPQSAIGIKIGERCMSWVNRVYGKKYAHLRTKKFEKGFGEGKGLEEVGLTPETVAWMDKAMDAYWRDRIYKLLNQVGTAPAETLVKPWFQILDDMYGDDNTRKPEIYTIALNDDKVSKEAKAWLKSLLDNK